MFSCKKASHLISASLDRGLTAGERFSLRFHLAICGMCRNFRKHVYFLHDMKDQWPTAADSLHSDESLTDEARERIQNEINRTDH
ncbi:MAG: hypothetical protein GC154_15500 [bacterium]|nr:hypothetical protein [bacterium]